MAAYYPEEPTDEFKAATRHFMDHFAQLYPCEHCKDHMIIYLKENPITLDSNRDFSTWMCNYHNQVNAYLGKRLIQCDADYLIHRYKDGYPKEAGVRCPNV
jgi:FAD-linked sulfhydryl oxidase